MDSEIENARKIILEVLKIIIKDLEGKVLNKKLIITAAGLENSMRNKRDGYTFFGSLKELVIILIFITEWKYYK